MKDKIEYKLGITAKKKLQKNDANEMKSETLCLENYIKQSTAQVYHSSVNLGTKLS